MLLEGNGSRMFRLTIAAAATLLSWSSLGQGTVVFNNRVPSPGIDAPVSRCDGTGAGAGVNAQLFLVSASGLATYTPLFPATTFRTIGGPAAAYYVLPPQTPVSVPGIRAGEDATIVMRAWEGASYQAMTLPLSAVNRCRSRLHSGLLSTHRAGFRATWLAFRDSTSASRNLRRWHCWPLPRRPVG